jgi:uracil-DNA glycosylase family protein
MAAENLFSRLEGGASPVGGPAAEPATLEDLYAAQSALEAEGPTVGRFVPGEGPANAALLFVGEQPGDQEDLAGWPFVGPAGQVLARALDEIGLGRGDVFLTNAVKRFHFTQRGKRRLHEKPSTDQIRKERWWLEKEIALVAPRLVVALGGTALHALAGKPMPVNRNRGPLRLPAGRRAYVTIHPSALLRQPDPDAREREWRAFVEDVGRARALAEADPQAGP